MISAINDKICEPQKTTFKLLVTPDALLAAPLYFYAGFSLSFFSGIFSTSIGNTKVSHLFKDTKFKVEPFNMTHLYLAFR